MLCAIPAVPKLHDFGRVGAKDYRFVGNELFGRQVYIVWKDDRSFSGSHKVSIG